MRKPGTIIRLKNIFSKIPARLTQFHDEPIILTVQIIEPLLFLTQSTTLKLFDHGHLYCEYRKVDSLKSRLKQVTKISKFHHVKFIGKYIEIEGYVTNLDLCIYHNNYQYLFNNFRPFFNQEMSDRIDEIFNHCILAVFPENSKDFIMKQKPIFPVYIFFVSFPEGSYAVNYTPHQCLKLNYTLEVLSEITIMLREQLFKDTITSKVCDKYLEKTVKKRQRAQFTRPQNFSFAGNIDDISLLKLLDENKDVRDNQPRNSIMETVVKNPKLCSSNVNDFNEEIIQTVKVPLTPLLPNDLKKYKAPKEITIKKSKKLLFSDSSYVLKSLKISHVISQIEKKFILCVLDIENRHVIAAMDQHASHERIKLEEIEKKLHILLESEECMIPLQVSNYEKSILIQQSKRLEK